MVLLEVFYIESVQNGSPNTQQVVDFNKQPFLREDREQVTPVFFIMIIHKPFLNRVIFWTLSLKLPKGDFWIDSFKNWYNNCSTSEIPRSGKSKSEIVKMTDQPS